jgi:thymidylate synthase (FAD)
MPQVRMIGITQPNEANTECVTAEELIAYAARVSNPSNQNNNETAPKLLRYLAKNHHWSPFEMVHVVMEITTTRDIARQILRHRSFSFQEFSQRYAVASNFVVSEARLQDTKNRQNSIENNDEFLEAEWIAAQEEIVDLVQEVYAEFLDRGLAKEVARKVLPEGITESVMYMSGSVRSWIHYCQERTKPGVQKEHRIIAEYCKSLLLDNFPSLVEVLNDSKPE